MIIAIDYDGTADDIRMQQFVRKNRIGNEFWVVTARKDSKYNRDKMIAVLNRLYLGFENVIFCNEEPKIDYIKALNADLYIDNENNELEKINDHTNTIALLWLNQ